MKKTSLSLLVVCLSITTFFSCNKIIDKANQLERVDLTIEVSGKKTEMTSNGFVLFQPSNNKQELQLSFFNAASLLTINAINVTILDFKESKTSYSVEKGEVSVTFNGDVEIYEDDSIEWKSQQGTVEITKFDGKSMEGKINATLATPKVPNKTLSLKNGVFKLPKFE